jgi:hypothetical protein
MGIAVVVRRKLPGPSRKRPSTRWAAVFGRWLLPPRRASALFCVRALMALATWVCSLSWLPVPVASPFHTLRHANGAQISVNTLRDGF